APPFLMFLYLSVFSMSMLGITSLSPSSMNETGATSGWPRFETVATLARRCDFRYSLSLSENINPSRGAWSVYGRTASSVLLYLSVSCTRVPYGFMQGRFFKRERRRKDGSIRLRKNIELDKELRYRRRSRRGNQRGNGGGKARAERP